MLLAGKMTAWLPTKKMPPVGLTVNCAVVLPSRLPDRESDGRSTGANVDVVGAALGAADGATTVLSEHPASTPTMALATTTQ